MRIEEKEEILEGLSHLGDVPGLNNDLLSPFRWHGPPRQRHVPHPQWTDDPAR